MISIPETTTRVAKHTRQAINERIRRETEENVRRAAARGIEGIERRLAELDREWDIERALEANAAGLSLAGVVLGAAVDRRFFLVPGIVSAFLLEHAVQGWCPPVGFFRRRGVRTAAEIHSERTALKALRGDFASVSRLGDPDEAIRAATQGAIRLEP